MLTWLTSRIHPLLIIAVMVVGWLMLTAASAGSTAAITAITGVLIVVVLPVVFKYVKLTGPEMTLFTYVASLVVGIIGGFVGGDLSFSNIASGNTEALFGFVTAAYGLQQIAFGLLKDSPQLSPLVK